jgi:hypothetical protein
VDGQITAIYSVCDDVLKTLHHVEDPQCRMSDAEVMTTAIVAALYFGGNLERARALLATPTYIPRMLSKSLFIIFQKYPLFIGTFWKFSCYLAD